MNFRVEQMRREIEDLNFRLPKHSIKEYQQMMIGEYLKNHPSILINGGQAVSFLDDQPFLSSYNRIVLGAHGPYVEFENKHLLTELTIPDDQYYRVFSEYKLKYIHYRPVDRTEKVYKQWRVVDYADYEVGKYYIDFYITSLCKINKVGSTNLNRL